MIRKILSINYINFVKFQIIDFYAKQNFFFNILRFISPIFGILITYFTYTFNNYGSFNLIFPNLILWIVLTRNFFIAQSRITGNENYVYNMSYKILGFNKYQLIWSIFLVSTLCDTIPAAFLYFVIFNFAFGLNYSAGQITSFLFLIVFSCFVLYSFGVGIKALEFNSKTGLFSIITYLVILLTSSSITSIETIDPNLQWFQWVSLFNPLGNLNLIALSIFVNKYQLWQFYLPLVMSFAYFMVGIYLWRYVVWLKK